jgi:hypothetical protein
MFEMRGQWVLNDIVGQEMHLTDSNRTSHTSYHRCVPNPSSDTTISDPPNLRCRIPFTDLIISLVGPLRELMMGVPALSFLGTLSAAAALLLLSNRLEKKSPNPPLPPPAAASMSVME